MLLGLSGLQGTSPDLFPSFGFGALTLESKQDLMEPPKVALDFNGKHQSGFNGGSKPLGCRVDRTPPKVAAVSMEGTRQLPLRGKST